MRWITMCLDCAHFREDEETAEQTCVAFGGRIPLDILMYGFDHLRNPYPGDNGIGFVPSGPVDVAFLDSFVGRFTGPMRPDVFDPPNH